MFKRLIKLFTGSDSDSSKSTVQTPGGVNDLENFVDYVVRALVDTPEEVNIRSEQVDEVSVIKINCKKEDIGKVVGKRGKTIMAIRSLVNGAAGRLQQRVNVEVVD